MRTPNVLIRDDSETRHVTESYRNKDMDLSGNRLDQAIMMAMAIC